MAENFDVLIKLIGNNEPCHSGHQVGEEWLWKDKTPENMCFAAYNSIYPFALVLKYGGKFPWQDDPNVVVASCPDPGVVNRFEITRIPEKKEPIENYDISIKLVGKDKEDPCSQGHKVGDEWFLKDRTPVSMCPSAYRDIYTTILVLMYGGQLPWQSDPDVCIEICPELNVGNRFEIRRISRK